MRKILFLTGIFFFLNIIYSFTQESLFLNLHKHLDAEYEELIKANAEQNWLSEADLQRIKNLKDYVYRTNIFLYEGLLDRGRPGCDDLFEPVFFVFDRYEFPAYAWCTVVYKHARFDIYTYVLFDILNYNGRGFNKKIKVRHSNKFYEEYELANSFDENYWNFMNELNFTGFAVWFEAGEINRVKFLHDSRDFSNLMKGSMRFR
nr:hypothetical protein [Saprospiraceae bacterium]